MPDMPRPRPIYLHRYRTRHGRMIWYVRKPGGNRIRIRGEFGSPEFQEAYRCAVEGLPMPGTRKARTGSLRWLWDQYHDTTAWRALSVATRRQRENIMLHVLALSGDQPFGQVTKSAIAAGR